MSGTYIVVTKEQMDAVFSGAGWECNSQGREYVYEWQLPKSPHIVILVYSSVHVRSHKGRGKGQDAIRVCAVNRDTDKGWIKSGRIYRTAGWQDRLPLKVNEVVIAAKGRLKP